MKILRRRLDRPQTEKYLVVVQPIRHRFRHLNIKQITFLSRLSSCNEHFYPTRRPKKGGVESLPHLYRRWVHSCCLRGTVGVLLCRRSWRAGRACGSTPETPSTHCGGGSAHRNTQFTHIIHTRTRDRERKRTPNQTQTNHAKLFFDKIKT